VPAIPEGEVTSKTYATALGSTIYQLQQEAKANNITLPPQYFFSFDAQNSKLTISPASLQPLAVQLGEVKAIAEIIFSAHVNALDSIQRVRVSEDDVAGPQGDYIDKHSITNNLAVITPYVVTFRCFTPELARVVSAFATATNTFLIRAINIQPAGAVAAAGEPMPGMPGMPVRNPVEASVSPVAGKGGLQTAVKEQLIRAALEVELVKLLPKS